MKKNMGTVDRLIRIIVALALGVLIFTGVLKGVFAIVISVLAVIFVLTSILGACPIYALFGIHTLRSRVSNDN